MQKTVTILRMGLLCAGFSLGITNAIAADVIKVDNSDPLNLGSSWVSGVPPTSADVGVWNSTLLGGNTVALGADTNWAGVRITNPGGPINITAGNALTIGAQGIDMSAATQDLQMDNTNVIGANQTWNVAAGRVLTVTSPLVGATNQTLFKTGGGTLIMNSAVNGTYSGNVSVDGGVLSLNSANGGNNSSAGVGYITNNSATLAAAAARIVGNAIQFNGNCVIDANNFSVPFDGAWFGSATVLITNVPTGATFTAGGNGNSAGSWANFTGTVLMGTNGGTLRFNNGGGNANVGNAAATVDLGTSTATFFTRNRNGNVAVGELHGGPNTVIKQGASSSGTSTYSIGGKNTSTLFEGSIIDGGTTAAGLVGVTKVGSGMLTLTGTNTFLGPTTVSAGVLQIGNGGTLGQAGNGTITVNANTTLAFNRSDNISITNPIAGSGTVLKSNINTLTYYGTNNSAGVTFSVPSGVLAVGDGAAIFGIISLPVTGTFDVSATTIFALQGTLSGVGTVTGGLVASNGAAINPGGNGVPGTLNFANGFTNTGGVTWNMDLSNIPTSTTLNDSINVTGDVGLSGANSILVNGTLASGTYKLLKYTGTLYGDTNNLSANIGAISNDVVNKVIALVVTVTRTPTNIVWKGDGAANLWDIATSTNWLINGNPAIFIANDTVRFNDVGSNNVPVSIVGSPTPTAVIVDATKSYEISGAGSISGNGSFTKTNSGLVSLLSLNGYNGKTIIGGGILEVTNISNGGAPSGIGASSSDATNLVLGSATLRYSGSSAGSDRSITLASANATIDVTNANLTIGGLTGPGALTKVGAGTLSLTLTGTQVGATVISNGVIALESDGANSDGLGNSAFGSTNNVITLSGGTLQLFGYNGSQGTQHNRFFNPLVVPAGQTGGLRMFQRGRPDSGANSGCASTLTGSGTLNLTVAYVRGQLDGNWSAFTGLINVTAKAGADEMRLNNDFGLANASVFLNDGVLLCRLQSNTTNDIGELAGTSLARIAAGTGTGVNTTWRVGVKNTSVTFAGTIEADNAIIKVGTGTWTLTGSNPTSGSTTVNDGILALGDGVTDGNLDGSTNFSIVTPGILNVAARSDGTLNLGLIVAQTLTGNSTVRGSLNVGSLGTVAPGLPVGTLTVTNVVTLGGTVLANLNRNAAQTASKLVAPSIALGGSLIVANVGPNLRVGDTFDLFDGVLTGGFTDVQLPPYYTWNTNNLALNGTISVVAVTGPTIKVAVGGGNVSLSATNGIPGGNVLVTTTTNLSVPISTWTPVDTNTFDLNGAYNLVVPINPGAPRQFYLLQAY